MLTIEELMNHIEKDNKILQTNLEAEIVRIPQLQTKYLRYHREYKETLIQAWKILSSLEAEKHLYYSGKASSDVYRKKPFNLVIKNQAELNRWISSDEDVGKLTQNIKLTEDCLEKVNYMLESLKYRSNHIATILEIRKYESGD